MEDIAGRCAWADAQLVEDPAVQRRIPEEHCALILKASHGDYLDSIARAARSEQYGDVLFPLYKPLYPELAARWLSDAAWSTLPELLRTIACLARIIPLFTCLRPYVTQLLSSAPIKGFFSALGSASQSADPGTLHIFLLALFRLLSFDADVVTHQVTPLFFSSFLRHPSPAIRHLAVECLCMTMRFADAFSEQMLEIYVGKEPVRADWEGGEIDYRLLKLCEERRWTAMATAVRDAERSSDAVAQGEHVQKLQASDFSMPTALVGDVLLPCLDAHASGPSTFALTPTAKRNLHQLGSRLLNDKHVLVAGPPGTGKTSLIHEAARLLNKMSSLLTLHINEQTDAKSLLGLYTSADGESFTWQPGVLTKALQQGRWVLLEDIDRAPAEVMGVLQPILEKGELFLANRKETIKARDGFRMLATTKSFSTGTVSASPRDAWLFNRRLWSIFETAVYELPEVELLLRDQYLLPDALVPTILRTHEQVCLLYRVHQSLKSTQSRTPSLRELLTWSRRLVSRFQKTSADSPSGALPESIRFDIFIDAVDCYAGHLGNHDLHDIIAACIAREMDISPQQMRLALDEPFTAIHDADDTVQVGENTLVKVARRRRPLNSAPFALTSSARRSMCRIAATVSFSEPCLLVGETGVGKTTLVQHIAGLVGQRLTVINLSQQSDASDLIGGLKPVTSRSVIMPLLENFNLLFEDTFSKKRNEHFHMAVIKSVTKQNWQRLLILWDEALHMAHEFLDRAAISSTTAEASPANKRRKLGSPKYDALRRRWSEFSASVTKVRAHVDHGDKSHVFAFVEGRLVEAVRKGEWVLLDEINLASPDTLDHIVTLLHNGDQEKPHLLLAESGNIEAVVAHPSFRIFAAMNPATDTGKRDLASGVRSRFTEIYIPSGDRHVEDVISIVQIYLGKQLDNDRFAARDLALAYLDLKQLNAENKLTDGAGEVPHFSIRSLVRCLMYVSQQAAHHGLRRAMYEGFAMSFFTVLSRASENHAVQFVDKHILSKVKNRGSFLRQQPKVAYEADQYVAFGHHLVRKGPLPVDSQVHYIRTPSVERNLVNLSRAASMRRFPILLQGPTSAGKTSMVEYLAKISGNKFVRINNHEHTDLQEYLGVYVSDTDGKLKYREGVLVDALRQGHWIVLDELNLAPSDVLEALNRLLDDNRELLIPESQEIVKPHPNFMLFATQNPAGLYGGRKRLSRAFRNRFLEIHFDDIPEDELEIILRERSQIAPSFCSRIVEVYKKLSLLRQSSRLFEQRNSFATLRDLFRWASRPADDRQQLAYHGFMLLAERVRDPAERQVVRKTIEATFKVTIDETLLYGQEKIPASTAPNDSIVWTPAMRRVFVLVSAALRNNEPVLLVGETGCGKTQICQVAAEAFGRPLDVYNAHSNTETGDLIGSQRPLRNRAEHSERIRESWRALAASAPQLAGVENLEIEQILEAFQKLDKTALQPEVVESIRSSIAAYQALFIWNDGSLVRAMKHGNHFLLDEISLADDSVLERLNSVLEPSRTILLAEEGPVDNLVQAHPGFQFLATMNPGGDYGKRELSAALRNRLTEIWVPPLSQKADVLPIVRNKLKAARKHLADSMLDFAVWFRSSFHRTTVNIIPLRDVLAWAEFINQVDSLSEEDAFTQGAFMVYVDSLGANPAGMSSAGVADLNSSRNLCLEHLQTLVSIDVFKTYRANPGMDIGNDNLCIGPFALPRMGPKGDAEADLVFGAPTTLRNTMRLVRGLQMVRPILLEGSPGVGKTALVTALAKLLGKKLTRINLSDQTDLMDLFGADAPASGQHLGTFQWQDGPLLDAMQAGEWVLLDEMNLATQSVLEGLNSCLDHRREVYIAELDKSFVCHPDFTLFAAQNPHHQGGGRKGLPASFVNRFTVVYADSFNIEDLVHICRHNYPNMPEAQMLEVIHIVTKVDEAITRAPVFSQGGPWELNLRDINRWLSLCMQQPNLSPSYHFRTVIMERFRTAAQRDLVLEVLSAVTGAVSRESFYNMLTSDSLQIGTSLLARNVHFQPTTTPKSNFAVNCLPTANSIITAVNQRWPVILGGPSNSGKVDLIRRLAAMSGVEMIEYSLNSDVDTMDLVGGFEQYDVRRDVTDLQRRAKDLLGPRIALALVHGDEETERRLLQLWHDLRDPLDQTHLHRTLRIVADVAPELQLDNAFEALRSGDNIRSRFMWNDGVLIDAIEKGWWILLDNANLCNPSVLDRLNSLLEPNGVLVVSEQHSVRGGSRTISPHPNFRIFLTVDPRFGELSRAMRNRSLEVFVPEEGPDESNESMIQYSCSSAIYRLRQVSTAMNKAQRPGLMDAYLDNLSFDEAALLSADPQSLLVGDCVERQSQEILNRISSNSHTWSLLKFEDSSRTWPAMPVLNEQFFILRIWRGEGSQTTVQIGAELFTRVCHIVRCLEDTIRYLSNTVDRANSKPAKDRGLLESSAIAAFKLSTNSADTNVFNFAEAISQALASFLKIEFEPQSDLKALDFFERTLVFVQDLISSCETSRMNMQALQAYQNIGQSLFNSNETSSSSLASALRDSLHWLIDRRTGQRTGSGLQLMWEPFRAHNASTWTQLETQLALEALVSDFDRICRSLPHSRASLFTLRTRLLQTYDAIVDSGEPQASLTALQAAVMALEPQSRRGFLLHGKFEMAMTFLYRTLRLNASATLHPSGDLLAMFVPLGEQEVFPNIKERTIPKALCRLAAVKAEMLISPVVFGLDLIKALSSATQQNLGLMEYAKEEVWQLAKAITSCTTYCDNSLHVMAYEVVTVLDGILFSHYELLTEDAKSCFSVAGTSDFTRLARIPKDQVVLRGPQTDFYTPIYITLLHPLVLLLTDPEILRLEELKICLLRLSLAGLILMVPEAPFDPAVVPRLKKQMYHRRSAELNARIDGLVRFHQDVMGQESSLVVEVLRNQVLGLGGPPSSPAVARPEPSELSEQQEVFTRISQMLPAKELDDLSFAKWLERWSNEQGKSNIRVLIDRLELTNRAYDDFVKPITWFLKCLHLSLELEGSISLTPRHDETTSMIISHTPLMSATPTAILYQSSSEALDIPTRFQWLEYWSLSKAVLGMPSSGSATDLVDVLDHFYLEWKTRLTKDQVEAAAKSRHYSYRGDAETDAESEEAEFQRMFPHFDHAADNVDENSLTYDARSIAIRLANLHQRLYATRNSQEAILGYVLNSLHTISALSSPVRPRAGTRFTDLLPAILLQMESKMADFSTEQKVAYFNIYTDPDLAEAGRLFSLIQALQTRFHAISDAWPEHAIPLDVLSFCHEVMFLGMGDPLAKLMTKAEKLYELASQWQNIASKEWSVMPLLERLSAIIISWRRLELLSWSKLLDQEQMRHSEDAQAWYFVAYEAVVHNSARMVADGENIKEYCRDLLQTLEEFLKTTTMGQYSTRLRLLGTLCQTLADIAQDNDGIHLIRTSVARMIDHYRRYEANIEEALQKGRLGFEKALKDQIQLSSWKDTNVTALRDSARRSHHKLFKIIRKYRGLLNQPPPSFKASADAISFSQFADSSPVGVLDASLSNRDLILQAQNRCMLIIPDWNLRPGRLTTPLDTIQSMHRLYLANENDFRPAREVSLFGEDLLAAIKELRKQTPSALTEENASLVKHLQERKRRLLIDTLKSVSQMGIRRNLPSSELDRQSSTAIVLSSSPSTPFSGANSLFHELLDLMIQVRPASADHSDDLTDGQTQRCVGLLEGLLSTVMNQRSYLAAGAADLSEGRGLVDVLRSFILHRPRDLLYSPTQTNNGELRRHLAWFAELLPLSCRVLNFQARHAEVDVEELCQSLHRHAARLTDLCKQFEDLPALPLLLSSHESLQLQEQSVEALRQLASHLKEWQTRQPHTSFILRQLLPWTEDFSSSDNGNASSPGPVNLNELDLALRSLLDQILVAIQKLPVLQLKLPGSIDDAGWLLQCDKYAAQAIRSLQISTVNGGLRSLMDKFHGLRAEDFDAAMALLCVAFPIIEQYSRIAGHLVEEQVKVHLETTRLAAILSRSFITLASQGFCRPSEPEDGQENTGALENGTGLGEGEGAEDISKDIGADEDLSELAQSVEKEEHDEVDSTDDAVDMGQEELQGEMDDTGEQNTDDENEHSSSDGEDDEDIEEEVGSVDDLDPSAVDEKLWDDLKKDSQGEKERKGDQAEGAKSGEPDAADEGKTEGEDQGGDEVEEHPDEGEEDDNAGSERPEPENMDPHLDSEQALDLPEELELAGEEDMQKDDFSDENMEELSDVDQASDTGSNDKSTVEPQQEPSTADVDETNAAPDGSEDEERPADGDEINDDPMDDSDDETQVERETREVDTTETLDQDGSGETGHAGHAEDKDMAGQVESGPDDPPPSQSDHSQPGKASNEDDTADSGLGPSDAGIGRMDTVENQRDDPMRKLADVLDQWHQRRTILPASEDHGAQERDGDIDMKKVDLEHIEGDDEADTQALGAAALDQAQHLDHTKAIEDDDMSIHEDTDIPDPTEPEQHDNIAERFKRNQTQINAGDTRETGGFIPSMIVSTKEPPGTELGDLDEASDNELFPEMEHLDITRTEPPIPPTSVADAAQLWNQCSLATHQFSLVLAEQLRLILSPTTATKLRGDYRTGKRLNIKRIIPYIASNYKRDKIWMRRSVPSKRNYQIMIAVDDSKSMSEFGADVLAFETLALLTKALSMVESGDLCVVGFGDQPQINVAHSFGTPFSPAESGVNIFRAFSFNQRGTNVRTLVHQSIQLFRDARGKGHIASEDLWQLQLIVSDGHCSDHDTIARLVRQAHSEKIIIVFVMVDAGPESILDLKEAVFEPDPNISPTGGPGELRVRTKRYLEDFPFPYYLVVRDVRELPGVLATALKGWFGSIVDIA